MKTKNEIEELLFLTHFQLNNDERVNTNPFKSLFFESTLDGMERKKKQYFETPIILARFCVSRSHV